MEMILDSENIFYEMNDSWCLEDLTKDLVYM